jgi:hypothetical protein
MMGIIIPETLLNLSFTIFETVTLLPTVDLIPLLWHNPANLKKAVMETSKPGCASQRTRVWCEPGLAGRQKILPEPQAERCSKTLKPVGAPGSPPVIQAGRSQSVQYLCRLSTRAWQLVKLTAGKQGGTTGN